jgi:hypothetical protein
MLKIKFKYKFKFKQFPKLPIQNNKSINLTKTNINTNLIISYISMFSSEYKNNINKENINPEFNNENIDDNKVHNSLMELELNKTTDITPKINRENKTNFQALKRIENILSSNNNISSDKISFKTELKPLKIYPEKNVNKTFGRPESNNIFTYSNEEKYSLLKIKKIKNKKFSPYKSTNVLFNNVENFYDEQKNESDSKNIYFRMNKNKKIYSLRKDYISIISFQDNKNNKKDFKIFRDDDIGLGKFHRIKKLLLDDDVESDDETINTGVNRCKEGILAAINLVKKNKNEYASTYKKYIDNDP